MGSEDKVHDIDWYQSNESVDHLKKPSPPSNKHRKQQDSVSKLLTLPTILTIGRVIAVPLLISSANFFYYALFSYDSFVNAFSYLSTIYG